MAKFSSNNQLMVSVFNNIWDTDNENLTKICDVKTILDIIRTGDYGVAAKINAIRSAVAKEQRDELKKHLFVITWQGIFSRKNNNGCESLSSLVCIDIDHQAGLDLVGIKQVISGWPFVLAYFLSPSGDGLKVVIITDNYSIDDYGNCYRHSSSSGNNTTQPDKPFLTAEGFIAEMNRMRCTLTDDQIINILNIKWSKFPNNYQDGHRTKSVFAQACGLCKAGIDMEKALDYLKSKFLPTGFDEDKVDKAVYNAYDRNQHLYGSERSNYRSYNEYKLGH